VKSLAKISVAEKVYIGTPAATGDRSVIDASYSAALIVILKDMPAHDAYQVDPIHLAFIASCKAYWTRIQVYDAASPV
jgi:hypothetical protein